MTQDELEDAIIEMAEQDIEGTLNVVANAFIGLSELIVRHHETYEEGDELKKMEFSGTGRAITLHEAAMPPTGVTH